MTGSKRDQDLEDFKDSVYGQMGIRTGTTTNEIFLNIEEGRRRNERERMRFAGGGGVGEGGRPAGAGALVLVGAVAAGLLTGSWLVGLGVFVVGGGLLAVAASFPLFDLGLRLGAFALLWGFFVYVLVQMKGYEALWAAPVPVVAVLVAVGLQRTKRWFLRTRLWAFIVLCVSWIVFLAVVAAVVALVGATVVGML